MLCAGGRGGGQLLIGRGTLNRLVVFLMVGVTQMKVVEYQL